MEAGRLGGGLSFAAAEHGETEQARREQGEGRRFTDHAVRRTEIPQSGGNLRSLSARVLTDFQRPWIVVNEV